MDSATIRTEDTMRPGFVRCMHLWGLLAGASWLALAALPANAQTFYPGGQACPPPPFCPTPGMPYPAPPTTMPSTPSTMPPSTTIPPSTTTAPAPFDLSTAWTEGLTAAAGGMGAFAPGMLGDLGAG